MSKLDVAGGQKLFLTQMANTIRGTAATYLLSMLVSRVRSFSDNLSLAGIPGPSLADKHGVTPAEACCDTGTDGDVLSTAG